VVRAHGASVSERLLSVEEAQALALAPVRALSAERVMLADALGRVLADAVVAPADVPPHDNSAMDGYALRAVDGVAGARLQVVGVVAAGHVATRPLGPGEAYRIMTGAPIPPGADAVIMQEETERDGDVVQLAGVVAAGAHVRGRGEDLRAGDIVLERGTTLDAAAIGVAASARRSLLAVTRRPRVAIVSTGDELRALDQPLEPGAIAESNSWALAALVRAAGGIATILPIAPDDPARIADALREAARADLAVTTGGVSVGDHDHVKPALAALGATLNAWRVDMKPGKPVALAVLDGTPLYGLPGNPASAMVAFLLFVRPAIRAALGCAVPVDLPKLRVRLAAPLKTRNDRRTYVRAQLVADAAGHLQASPLARQGSGALTSMRGANALLVVAAGPRQFIIGDELDALLIGPLAG
jgi:molybdopterin molybdotransferase